jgi:hypothetical protein
MAKRFDVTGYIISFESGELSAPGVLKLFSHLVKTGLAWTLQGSYGRTARALIAGGYLDHAGTVLKEVSDE